MTAIGKTETAALQAESRERSRLDRNQPAETKRQVFEELGEPVVAGIARKIEGLDHAFEVARVLESRILTDQSTAMDAQANQSENIVEALTS